MEPNGANGSQNGNANGKAPVLRNHVAIVFDESGSMQSMRQEAMDAFNQQVNDIREKAKGQKTTVSLVKFNTNVPNPVYWAEPVERLRPLTPEDYAPNGMTAMLDAVGLTIDRLKTLPDADDEDTSFLILIISDGQENNSKTYTYAAIAERIQELDRTDRWTFTYLGANQDLSHVSQRMHIPAANVSAFVADAAGMVEGSQKMRTSSDRFFTQRLLGHKSSKAFYVDPDPTDPGDPSQPPSSTSSGTRRQAPRQTPPRTPPADDGAFWRK